MAVVFSKNSGLNDDLWGEWSTLLVAKMNDVDTEKNNDDELVKALFNVKKSDKFGEKAAGMTSFGDFEIVAEGADAVQDELQEGFAKLIEHKQFIKSFVCTAEMAEDGNFDEMALAAQNFMRAYKRSRAQYASDCLVTEGATFTFGSKTGLDKTTGDAKGLFATDHPGKKAGVAAQANVFTNAFGTDSVMLNKLANVGRNFRNASGIVMGYTFDTIIIPGNTPELEDTIKRIIRSDLQAGSELNDINTQKGLWKLIVDHRWTVEEGAPYILMSSEANKELLGNVFYDRIPLNVRNEVKNLSRNLEWSGRARFSAGFYDWRHIIMGGAKVSETL
jgi:hypothetical protein